MQLFLTTGVKNGEDSGDKGNRIEEKYSSGY